MGQEFVDAIHTHRETITTMLSEKMAKRTAELSSITARQLAGEDVDPMEVAVVSSAITEIGDGLARLANYHKLELVLEKQNLCCFPVPGDGSCGLHSILALELGLPAFEESQKMTLARVRSLRDEIARLWTEKAADPHWVQFYGVIVDVFDDGPPVSEPARVKSGAKTEPAAGVKREIKEEPISPSNQRKRRAFAKPTVDLSTPPARVKPESDPLINTPPCKFRKTADDCMDLVTPPRVEKVGGARNAMRKQADSKTKAAAHAKMSAAVVAVAPKAAPGKAGKSKQKPKPKTAAKTKAKKPADTDLQPDPVEEEQAGSAKKPRTRIQKKEHTMEAQKLEVVNAYLLRLRMSWPESQKFHTLHPVDEHAADCKQNQGWNTMKTRLTELKPPECLTCLAYLRAKLFDMEKLTELLFNCQNPDPNWAWKDLQSILTCYPAPEVEASTSDPPCEAIVPALSLGPVADDGENPPPEIPLAGDTLKMIKAMRCIEILLPGTAGKLRPVICRACTTRKSPEGKIFDLTASYHQSFLKQHCITSDHRRFLLTWLEKQRAATSPEIPLPETQKKPEVEMQKCTGLVLTHSRNGRLSRFAAEVKLWARHTNLASPLNRHTYQWDPKSEKLVLFHDECAKVAMPSETGTDAICPKCAGADKSQNAVKGSIRFATKYWLAKLLNAKLFRSNDDVAKVTEQIQATEMYKAASEKMSKLLDQTLLDLQSWVRARWGRVPHKFRNEPLIQFLETCVEPSLTVNVSDCSSELRTLTAVFSEKLVAGNLSEFSQLCCKIAKFVSQGKLAERPAVMGMVLQCMDAIQRQDQG